MSCPCQVHKNCPMYYLCIDGKCQYPQPIRHYDRSPPMPDQTPNRYPPSFSSGMNQSVGGVLTTQSGDPNPNYSYRNYGIRGACPPSPNYGQPQTIFGAF